jgi:hypothetical protein
VKNGSSIGAERGSEVYPLYVKKALILCGFVGKMALANRF